MALPAVAGIVGKVAKGVSAAGGIAGKKGGGGGGGGKKGGGGGGGGPMQLLGSVINMLKGVVGG